MGVPGCMRGNALRFILHGVNRRIGNEWLDLPFSSF
jgi:hypothetical protein